MKHLIVVRGGGELASGIVHTLYRAGFRVLILEQAQPSATRRRVAFSDAMYRGEATVERVTCHRVQTLHEARTQLKDGRLVMLDDPSAKCVRALQPQVLVDAIMAHHNTGTKRDMAEHTIGLGPGFCAGRDVDVVVETMRGHNLGRLIYEGFSARDQGTENSPVGYACDLGQMIVSPADGTLEMLRSISLLVKRGESIAHLHTPEGQTVELKATIDGVLRGALHTGASVVKGQKVVDIHPTMGQEECFTISDKARCIAGSVLEAIMVWDNKRPRRRFFHRD